jgi:hypothetical protein
MRKGDMVWTQFGHGFTIVWAWFRTTYRTGGATRGTKTVTT